MKLILNLVLIVCSVQIPLFASDAPLHQTALTNATEKNTTKDMVVPITQPTETTPLLVSPVNERLKTMSRRKKFCYASITTVLGITLITLATQSKPQVESGKNLDMTNRCYTIDTTNCGTCTDTRSTGWARCPFQGQMSEEQFMQRIFAEMDPICGPNARYDVTPVGCAPANSILGCIDDNLDRYKKELQLKCPRSRDASLSKKIMNRSNNGRKK